MWNGVPSSSSPQARTNELMSAIISRRSKITGNLNFIYFSTIESVIESATTRNAISAIVTYIVIRATSANLDSIMSLFLMNLYNN